MTLTIEQEKKALRWILARKDRKEWPRVRSTIDAMALDLEIAGDAIDAWDDDARGGCLYECGFLPIVREGSDCEALQNAAERLAELEAPRRREVDVPGHYFRADQCKFWKHTRIDERYVVSTIGEVFDKTTGTYEYLGGRGMPGSPPMFYETAVFDLKDGDSNVEIDGARSNGRAEAIAAHERYVAEYMAKPADEPRDGWEAYRKLSEEHDALERRYEYADERRVFLQDCVKELTSSMARHPEGYEGPCDCRFCVDGSEDAEQTKIDAAELWSVWSPHLKWDDVMSLELRRRWLEVIDAINERMAKDEE
jgi:hypothetical protein